MIDLHTHSLLSDGALLPSELVRRAVVKGYETICIADHVDSSNVDFVVPRLAKVCNELNAVWPIKVIPGAELTHVPLEHFETLIKLARDKGAKIIIIHGETTAEPVLPGTNRKALDCDIDILAHPGMITEEDTRLAKEKGIYLELTSKRGHNRTNRHVAAMAREAGARLIFGSDAHGPDDLLTKEEAQNILRKSGLSLKQAEEVFVNAQNLVDLCSS